MMIPVISAHGTTDFTMTSQHVKSPDTVEPKLEPTSDEPLQRGRKKLRDDENEAGEDGTQPNGERKRKRSRKSGDKKYLCPSEGCGKSYSRAEHLYRHQLNHSPKRIYSCDFPDCKRQFVRQDLCVRHKERHTTKGSNLQRKESYHPQPLGNSNAKTTAALVPKNPAPINNDASIPPQSSSYNHVPALNQSPVESMGPPRHNTNDSDRFHHAAPLPSHTPYQTNSTLHRPTRENQYYPDNTPPTPLERDVTTFGHAGRHDSFGQMDAYQRPPTGLQNSTENNNSNSMQWNGPSRVDIPRQNRNQVYNTYPQPYSTVAAGPSLYPHAPQNGTYPQPYFDNSNQYISRSFTSEEMVVAPPSETPMNDINYRFFDDAYLRSPAIMSETVTHWLFDRSQDINQLSQSLMNEFVLDPSLQMPFDNQQSVPPQTSMSVSSLLEAPAARTSVISPAKHEQILSLIEKTFHVVDNSAIEMQREQLFMGDTDAESHILSRHSMQRYIVSYWYHFHEQMPILHRPTFSADKCQSLLLIAVLAIGAANLDKAHGKVVTTEAADLATFLAWHLRGKLFEDKDFPPPTKLWVLQTLILLECYEKLYSTRSLHERSTIHHATTISLLRRGNALWGAPTMDPGEENKHLIADTSDSWWNLWITKEATTRVAYALFIIDSIHAAMFGHTAVMLAHELRLHLPCDDTLWTASSGMQVNKLEVAQTSEKAKPILFLEGLKRTLHGQPVRTNRFGRTALMAGLLNVTFHLQQRDVLRSFRVIPGEQETAAWRAHLTKAFDIWANNWDNDHEPQNTSFSKGRHLRESSHSSTYSTSTIDEEHTFESRVVLHHLAHMMMSIDIVQCQIYAKAGRLLGRAITQSDYTSCVRKMKAWAPRIAARDSAFFSLKFLGAVLVPDSQQGVMLGQTKPPLFRSVGGEYVPRDDYLLNRPWVVYYAALIVWSYGYALDGPLKASAIPKLDTKEEKVADMLRFMSTVGAVAEPQDLANLIGQRNTCAGLLSFLGGQFKQSRWQLMDEASRLMGNCVDMLCGINNGGGSENRVV